ncbi:MAG TPA: hypothetical protein VHQ65_01915, partial [Thermoanaerobaculia bacterium]|nr:hypothetical protein [Thermoanaerobaculia bacterium]
MDERSSQLDAVLETVARLGPGAAHHVAAEELVDYHHDRVTPRRGEEIREHLALCGECSDLLLELEVFEADAAPDAAQEGVVDFEEAAAWRHLADRLAAEG